jgi:transcriptional regulator with XRE-family HTH domain
MDRTRRHTVADNVRAEKARRGVTQAALAKALGMSQQALSRRLVGEVAFDVDELDIIARHLDVPTAELLGDDVPAATG